MNTKIHVIRVSDDEVYLLLRSVQYVLSKADSDHFNFLIDQNAVNNLQRVADYLTLRYQNEVLEPAAEVSELEKTFTEAAQKFEPEPDVWTKKHYLVVVRQGPTESEPRLYVADGALLTADVNQAIRFKHRDVAIGVIRTREQLYPNEEITLHEVNV